MDWLWERGKKKNQANSQGLGLDKSVSGEGAHGVIDQNGKTGVETSGVGCGCYSDGKIWLLTKDMDLSNCDHPFQHEG